MIIFFSILELVYAQQKQQQHTQKAQTFNNQFSYSFTLKGFDKNTVLHSVSFDKTSFTLIQKDLIKLQFHIQQDLIKRQFQIQ